MPHIEIEIGKVEKPASLAAIQRLRLSGVCEIFVVSEDLDREGGAMEIVAPCFQGANDGKEFAVVDVVIPFRRGERLREVGARVPVAIGVSLKEDSSRSEFGGISGNGERCREVGRWRTGLERNWERRVSMAC